MTDAHKTFKVSFSSKQIFIEFQSLEIAEKQFLVNKGYRFWFGKAILPYCPRSLMLFIAAAQDIGYYPAI